MKTPPSGTRPGRDGYRETNSRAGYFRMLVTRLAWVMVALPALALSNWSLYVVGTHFGIPGALAWMVSIAIDGSALIAANTALNHARENRGSGFLPRAVFFTLGGLSAWLNSIHPQLTAHATNQDLLIARIMYAVLPLIALLTFEIQAEWERREALFKAGRIADPLPKLGTVAWLWHPIRAFRTARSIARSRLEKTFVLEKTRTDSQLVLEAESGTLRRRAYALPKPIRGADGNILPCTYCENPVAVRMDHIHPRSRGGTDEETNLVPACIPCDLSKSAKLLSEWLPERVAYAVENSDKVRAVFEWQQSEWAELDKLQRSPRAEAIRIALSKLGDLATTSDIESWLSDRGILVDSSYIRLVRSRADGSVDTADQERNTNATLTDMSATSPDASTSPDDIWDTFADMPATSPNGVAPAGDRS